jgi:hypothetical protein
VSLLAVAFMTGGRGTQAVALPPLVNLAPGSDLRIQQSVDVNVVLIGFGGLVKPRNAVCPVADPGVERRAAGERQRSDVYGPAIRFPLSRDDDASVVRGCVVDGFWARIHPDAVRRVRSFTASWTKKRMAARNRFSRVTVLVTSHREMQQNSEKERKSR